MNKNIYFKLLFSLLLFMFLTINVNAGVSTSSCGAKGQIALRMSSRASYAGFDSTLNTCNWQTVGMTPADVYQTADSVVDGATANIRNWTSKKTVSGASSVGDGYEYVECRDKRTTVTVTGHCSGGYGAQCSKKYHSSKCHPGSVPCGVQNGQLYYCWSDCAYTTPIYKDWCCCNRDFGKGCTATACAWERYYCPVDCSMPPETWVGGYHGIYYGTKNADFSYNSWTSNKGSLGCGETKTVSCPKYRCNSKRFSFGACTPRYETTSGNPVYCVTPDAPFSTGVGQTVVYGVDDFDVTKCLNSYSTVDCGFANILIEARYNNITDYNTINLAMRLWSYHTERKGFNGTGISSLNAPVGGGSCDLGEFDNRYFIPPLYNVYAETYNQYITGALQSIGNSTDYIEPSRNVLTGGLIGCNQKLGVACNGRRDVVNTAFALLTNTIKGNSKMLDHLGELYPDFTSVPTGVLFEPSNGTDDKTDVIVQYGQIFNYWEKNVKIDCNSLVAGTREYNQVKPYCKVKIIWYDKYGTRHEQLPKSCTKSVGCRYEKLSLAFCDKNVTGQAKKITVVHPETKASGSIMKLENCSSVNSQLIYAFVEKRSNDTRETEELIEYDLPSYTCEGACEDYEVRTIDGNGTRQSGEMACKFKENKVDGDVYRSSVKDPSLRCVLNMRSPREKFRYDYSQEFGVNTNICRVYCSDEVEFSIADRVTINSGEDFKYNINGKIEFGNTENKLISNMVEEKRTCVSEIYWKNNFTSTIDFRMLYDLDNNPANVQQLYDALNSKSVGSESSRTENLNQVLYDLYNCNFYNQGQISSYTDGKVQRPKENMKDAVYVEATNKYFNKNDAYGLGFSRTCSASRDKNTCIQMSTITYTGGAEYIGTSDSMDDSKIFRVGDKKRAANKTSISVDSLTEQEISGIKYCKDDRVASGDCFHYNPSNDLDYSYPSMDSSFTTKGYGRTSVRVPNNDYAYFVVKTKVAFYNSSQFKAEQGSGYVVNLKDTTAAKPTYKSLADFSYPTSKDGYYLCANDTKDYLTRAGMSISNIQNRATHSCKVDYEFANINTYYRKNYPDNFFKTLNETYIKPTCYYDIRTTVPKTSPEVCKDKNKCVSAEYKNVDKTDIFPNGIPKDTNWDNYWGKAVKEYMEETAIDTFTEDYLEYSITLTPRQINNIRNYNKNSSLYQNAPIKCNVSSNNNYYNCNSDFMVKMRNGDFGTNYGTLDNKFNGKIYAIDSDYKTIEGTLILNK